MRSALEQMGKRAAEGEIDNIEQTMDQQPATVQLLDSTKQIFYVSKKAEGGELFDKVCAFLGLTEKDYFALSFTDDEGNQQWIYDDKRISKQLKGYPWDFNFKVKFYPPEPATLAEDITRHLLSLQVQHDISTGKLPATLATYALLGSYVAQSMRGDYESSLQYIDFLKSCHLAPFPNETLYEKIEELHRHHKGETSAEADLHYLENAKKLSMYGVQLFHAKDGKGTPVQIGISAHGINIYLDQIRVNRFLWQNIIKIGYRRNVFLIKVKPGELEKNESTVAFKLSDYEAAKRVWKCGVEHHTFFRLIQPEEKPHKGLFRWGSARFRYQGRTQFQSKMASQMFCNSHPVQRSQSVRLAQDDRNITVPVSISQTLPLMYSEDGAGRELGWSDSQVISPEKIYSMHVTESKQNVENDTISNGAEVGNTSNTSRKLVDNIYSSDIFTTSVTTAVTNNAAITTSTAITTTTFTSTSNTVTGHTLPSHVSPYATKIPRSAGLFTRKFSDDDFHGQPHYILDNSCESRSDMPTLRKEKDGKFLPIQDTAVVYHPGHYEEEMIGSHNRRFHEPPVEPGDDFVLVHGPKLASTGKIFHQNGAETDILVKEEDIETYPIRYFVDIYHSDFSRSIKRNKDFKVFEHEKYLGTDDVDKFKTNKKKYPTNEKFKGPISRTERSVELPTEPLTAHVYIYNQGYYDTVDSNRTDIDEKGNIRYWFRRNKKPEKSQTKLLKEKNTEIKKKTEKNASKLINDNRTINKSESINEQENETKKIALIHVKQPSYEKQSTQASYIAESSEKKLPQTAYLKGSKPVVVGIDTDKSSINDTKEETYDSTQPKQTCHLISTSDSCRARPGAYGVPSTSYDELLHNIRREEELPSLPIHEHAVIYHPGVSGIKDRKRRKFLIRKEQQKTSSSETSTDAEVPVDGKKKYTAVIDISDTGKNDLTSVVDVEKRVVDEEISKKPTKQEMKEKKYLDQMKGGITVDSKMQKSMHKIEKDTKLTDVQDVKSESSHQKMKAILHLSEGQSKPVSSEMKKEPVLKRVEKSKDVKHAVLPTFNKLDIDRSLERSKKAKLFEQSQNEHVLDNTPPPMKLSRINEISFQPLHLAVKVQNQEQIPSHYYKTFKRAKHEGTVEIVAKENINPATYKLEYATYQGPLETTNFIKGLQFAPIHEYSAVYHPGNTYVKTRKIKKRKNASELQNEQKSSTSKAKKTAILHLNRNDSDAKHREEEKSDSEAFLSKNESGITTYTAETARRTPANEKIKIKKHPFKHRTVSGDVEIVEKCFVKPETYNLVTVPYDGPLSCLEYGKELSFTPLQENASIYHSGISYKKAKKLRDSSTESSSTTSFSSSSSTSSVSENHKEFEKKIILRNKFGISNGTDKLAKHQGIFSFWRKSFRSEKGDLPDGKKEKLEASSKLQFIQQQQQPEHSVDFTKSRTSSSPLKIVSKVDSVEELKTDLHLKNKNKKMKANLYLKDEPLTTSENDEDNSKRGKFDLFHFWRSPDKESKISSKKITDMNISNEESLDYTTKFDSSCEEATIGLTTEGKKKPIIVTNKDVSSNIEANELARSRDMKDEPLNRSSVSPSNQDITNVETKKNAFIYLKRDSELSDGLPLNLKSIPGIPEQEITSAALTALQSPDQINVTRTSADSSENIGYTAKITVKREMRNVGDDLQQDSNLKRKETDASNDGVNKRSNFVVKGFHLRGPPCDSEEEIATYSSTRYRREKDTQVTEPTESSGIITTGKHETDSVNGTDKPITREGIDVLRIKKGTMIEGDVKLKGNKKDGGKSTKGRFFSSLWRGSKPKSSDQEDHQKQQKLIKSDVHGIELTHVNTTSPTNELEYNILRTKIILGSDCKEVKPSSNVPQIRQDFVPVYDFSYVPNFATFIENVDIAPAATAGDVKKSIIVEDSARKPDEIITDEVADETRVSGESEFKQQFNYRSEDIEEYNNTSAVSENQNENWKSEQSAIDMGEQTSMEKMFVSELNGEKLETKKHTIQGTGSETLEVGKLFDRSEISSGETSEESYTFTQTPPDIPVSMVYATDSKAPDDFVEQIKQQVTQAITEVSPSSDITKKSKKEKKRLKIGTSSHGSESADASEIELASHYDSLSSNQSKKNADKPEVIGESPYEEAKLDEKYLPLKEHTEETNDLKNIEVVPSIHPADICDPLPHTNVESWQETIKEPETVITTIDHQGNITKKTIKKQQLISTVQQQVHQTSSASDRYGDSSSVVEIPDHKLAYESANEVDNENGNDHSDLPGELISSRTVTQGNRTIETITYKTEKNGIVETHVEHRVTIHSCDDIDHDAELSQAILEATNMNPDMTVEKIEVKHESHC